MSLPHSGTGKNRVEWMTVRAFEKHEPQIAETAYVDPAALVVGEVRIGDRASLWPMSVARGDVNRIEIGPGTNIQDGTVIHVTHDGPWSPGGIPTIIGRDVTVGHLCLVHACTIGDRCLIGMGSTLMDGAELGDEVLLAAGSLVSPGKSLGGGWLYRGRPARAVRELTGEEREMLSYSARHYVELAGRHRKAGR